MSADQRSFAYALEDELGRGGMGVVYRARHLPTGAERAIKLLSVGADDEEQRRFRLEVEALARAGGEGIVPIHESGIHQGRFFYAMALLPGGSLRTRLRAVGRMDWREATRLVATVARAVGRCHATGLVHRDLKPENLLLDLEGRPWVADFGCVRFLEGERLTQTGTTLGTPAYMAPEQHAGERGDPRADVFALGVTLHELVAGSRPFDGKGQVEIYLRTREGRRSPLTSVPGVPRALEAVVARALAPEPGQRFSDGGELARALEQLLEPPGKRSSSEPPRRRRRWLVVASCVLALVGGVGLVALEARPGARAVSPSPAPGVAGLPAPVGSRSASPRPRPSAPPPSLDGVLVAINAHQPAVGLAKLVALGPLDRVTPEERRKAIAAAEELYEKIPDPQSNPTTLEACRAGTAAFDIVTRLSPDAPVPQRIAQLALAGVHLLRDSKTPSDPEQFQELVHWLQITNRSDPGSLEPSEQIATELTRGYCIGLAKREDAIEEIDRLERADPRDAQFAIQRARIFMHDATRIAPPAERAEPLAHARSALRVAEERADALLGEPAASADTRHRVEHARFDARYYEVLVELMAEDYPRALEKVGRLDNRLLVEKETNGPSWAFAHARALLLGGGSKAEALVAIRRPRLEGNMARTVAAIAQEIESSALGPADLKTRLDELDQLVR